MTRQDILAVQSTLQRSGWCEVQECGNESQLEIAMALGEPVADPRHSLVRSLSPKTKSAAPKNSMSALFGLGDFPPHTDVAHWHTPARYILLRCVSGKSNTPTLVVDSRDFLTQQCRQEWARSIWKVTKIRFPFLCLPRAPRRTRESAGIHAVWFRMARGLRKSCLR
jgi:L-asparagine oxygenase